MTTTAPDPAVAVAAFDRLADEIVDSYCEFYPANAVDLGLHAYDGRIGDMSAPALAARLAALADQQARLAAIDPAALSPDRAHDHALAGSLLAGEAWQLGEFRWPARIPLNYLQAIDASRYVKRRYGTPAARAAALTAHLAGIPAVLAAAQANLDPILPGPPLEMAIEAFSGVTGYLADDLAAAFAEFGRLCRAGGAAARLRPGT